MGTLVIIPILLAEKLRPREVMSTAHGLNRTAKLLQRCVSGLVTIIPQA
jgi:hypothetical protein